MNIVALFLDHFCTKKKTRNNNEFVLETLVFDLVLDSFFLFHKKNAHLPL